MDRNTWKQPGQLIPLLVAAGTVIYAGNLVCVNDDGYAVPASADVTLTTMGVSDEMVDNSAGADGALTVLVQREFSFFMGNSTVTPVTQVMVGKSCYVADSVTVSALVGTEAAPTVPVAGKVLGVSPDGVWVYIA